jgi:hypothetical protein
VLAGCQDVQKQPAVSGPNDIGGTMVVAQPASPARCCPRSAGQIIEKQITDLLYDRLAEIGEDLNTVGDRGFRKQLADGGSGHPTRCRSPSTSTRAPAGTTASRCARATCATASR